MYTPRLASSICRTPLPHDCSDGSDATRAPRGGQTHLMILWSIEIACSGGGQHGAPPRGKQWPAPSGRRCTERRLQKSPFGCLNDGAVRGRDGVGCCYRVRTARLHLAISAGEIKTRACVGASRIASPAQRARPTSYTLPTRRLPVPPRPPPQPTVLRAAPTRSTEADLPHARPGRLMRMVCGSARRCAL
jgi:hypothetical protein